MLTNVTNKLENRQLFKFTCFIIQTIRLEFCRRLRGERKFDSLEVLRQEIQHNIAQTRDYFCGEA